mgnify:CR=1 FL=1
MKKKSLFKEHFNTVIGGVVSQKPFATNMSLTNLVKEKYGNVDEEKIDVKGLTNEISNFGQLGETIFGKSNIKQVAEKLSWIANQAKNHTLSETEDWFDKITVNRNMKELTGLSNQFKKVASEAQSLQERMSTLYEDMGHILGRYYEINGEVTETEVKEEFNGVVREGEYEEFFQGAMKKFGISSPDELDDEEKKKFFNYVDKNYSAKNEKD